VLQGRRLGDENDGKSGRATTASATAVVDGATTMQQQQRPRGDADYDHTTRTTMNAKRRQRQRQRRNNNHNDHATTTTTQRSPSLQLREGEAIFFFSFSFFSFSLGFPVDDTCPRRTRLQPREPLLVGWTAGATFYFILLCILFMQRR
jgi:hypothetical protein